MEDLIANYYRMGTSSQFVTDSERSFRGKRLIAHQRRLCAGRHSCEDQIPARCPRPRKCTPKNQALRGQGRRGVTTRCGGALVACRRIGCEGTAFSVPTPNMHGLAREYPQAPPSGVAHIRYCHVIFRDGSIGLHISSRALFVSYSSKSGSCWNNANLPLLTQFETFGPKGIPGQPAVEFRPGDRLPTTNSGGRPVIRLLSGKLASDTSWEQEDTRWMHQI
jgi:hypothetical protein